MRIAVLGAGISGLATGYYLKKKYPHDNITIYECSGRLGGNVQSIIKDGIVFEQGPRGIRPKGKGLVTLELVKELGIINDVIPANPAAKKRYILINNRLQKVPENPFQALSSPITKGIITAIVKDICHISSCKNTDITIAEYAQKKFGKNISNYAIDPIMSGVYAGDIEKLSLKASLPFLADLENETGSIFWGMFRKKREKFTEESFDKNITQAPLFSFRKGMGQFIQALAHSLSENILNPAHITSITHSTAGYNIITADNTFSADMIVSTIPAFGLADLIHDNIELSDVLKKIFYAPIAVISLAYEGNINPLQGFGYLVPHSENQKILGVLWNDQIFPELVQPNTTVFTVMIGGARFHDFSSYDENLFIQTAKDSLEKYLNITASPMIQMCRIIPRAIPQYETGHLERIDLIQRLSPKNFHIRGNFIGGIGIADSVKEARSFAAHLSL